MDLPGKFVEIEWDDANSSTGWCLPDGTPRISKCVSRGWIVHEDVDQIVLVATLGYPGGPADKPEFNQCIAIPLGMVTGMTEII